MKPSKGSPHTTYHMISMPDELSEKVIEESKRQRRSISNMIRHMVWFYVDYHTESRIKRGVSDGW